MFGKIQAAKEVNRMANDWMWTWMDETAAQNLRNYASYVAAKQAQDKKE